MTSRRRRHARRASRQRRLPLRPSAQPHVTSRPRHSSRRPPVRLARPRLSRGRLRGLRRSPRPSRRLLLLRQPQKHPPRHQLNLLLRPSRPRRSRRAPRRSCRRLAPRRPRARCRRRVHRRLCRRHGASSPQAAKNPRGRYCHRLNALQRVPRNRRRHRGPRQRTQPGLHCRRRPACRCRRSLPTVGRSRRLPRRLVRVRVSGFPRRRVLHAPLHAAAARTDLVPPAGSGVPQAAVTVRTVAARAVGALTRERRQLPAVVRADPLVVLVREDRGAHRVADHEADRAAAVAASARNCSLSSSPPIRRWMRQFPRARSSSSGDRRHRKLPPG